LDPNILLNTWDCLQKINIINISYI
jgi:hypothetical protein